MERVAGIEPAHRPWQGCRLPLHHTRLQIWWTVRESNSSLKLAKLPCYHYHQQPISIKKLTPIYSISQIKKQKSIIHLGGFMGIFNPQIISRTQPLVIVSDLAKFKPLPMSDI